jgi:hypothetical protein
MVLHRNALCLAGLALALLAGCATPPKKQKQAAEYPYHTPLFSPGTQFGGLPPVVQRSVRAQAGTADIYHISKFTRSGRTIYKIRFVDEELFPPMYVETDGSILYPDLSVAVPAEDTIGAVSGGAASGMKVEDLPTDALKTIHEKAPAAEIGQIYKHRVGSITLYEVIFKGGKTPTMYVAEDGTLVAGK